MSIDWFAVVEFFRYNIEVEVSDIIAVRCVTTSFLFFVKKQEVQLKVNKITAASG